MEAELERLRAAAAAVMPSPPRATAAAAAAAEDDSALAAALADLEQVKAEAASYAARVREEREAAAARLKAATDKAAALEKEMAKLALKVCTLRCSSNMEATCLIRDHVNALGKLPFSTSLLNSSQPFVHVLVFFSRAEVPCFDEVVICYIHLPRNVGLSELGRGTLCGWWRVGDTRINETCE